MKKIVVIYALAATMIILSSSAVYAGCNELWVGHSDAAYVIVWDEISCAHGYPKHGEFDDALQVKLISGDFYGPDCTIGFTTYDYYHEGKTYRAVVRFQQNLCVLEGADITVTPISGRRPIYTIRTGAVSGSQHGTVDITGWE